MDRKIVIIPTYNEKENIEAITRKVFLLPGEFHILVIDSLYIFINLSLSLALVSLKKLTLV